MPFDSWDVYAANQEIERKRRADGLPSLRPASFQKAHSHKQNGRGGLMIMGDAVSLFTAAAHVTKDIGEAEVHILPSTARKAAALGLFKFYRVYEVLKHIDRVHHDGRGKFVIGGEILQDAATACGVSPLTIKRTIRDEAAQGLFWRLTITPKWRADDILYVELVSRKNVELALSERAAAAGVYDAYQVSRRKALLRLADFEDLQTLAAFCFASWLAVRKGSEFTGRWADLVSAWGRSRRTIREWIAISGVTIVHNFGYIPAEDTAGPALNAALTLQGNDVPTWRETIDGKEYVVFYRANTFVAPGQEHVKTGRRGIAKRAAAHLRRGGDSPDFTRTNHDMLEAHDRYRKLKRIRKLRNLSPERTHYTREAAFKRKRYRQTRQVNRWDILHYGMASYAS